MYIAYVKQVLSLPSALVLLSVAYILPKTFGLKTNRWIKGRVQQIDGPLVIGFCQTITNSWWTLLARFYRVGQLSVRKNGDSLPKAYSSCSL